MENFENFEPKRVVAIHSLAGFGRSSMAVILPVLSALGAQCCPVPTAVLSTHTGGLGKPAITPLSDMLPQTLAHYQDLGVPFAGLYTGYLGEAKQIDACVAYCKTFPHAFKLVDPVMGDNGAAYSGMGQDLIARMANLCRHADLMTPNPTEAALLLGQPTDQLVFDDEKAKSWCSQLGEICPQVIITGADFLDGKYNLVFANGQMSKLPIDFVNAGYPGTGDLFASTLLGYLLRQKSLICAVKLAGDFVRRCVLHTYQLGTDTRFGVCFEQVLPTLWEES